MAAHSVPTFMLLMLISQLKLASPETSRVVTLLWAWMLISAVMLDRRRKETRTLMIYLMTAMVVTSRHRALLGTSMAPLLATVLSFMTKKFNAKVAILLTFGRHRTFHVAQMSGLAVAVSLMIQA